MKVFTILGTRPEIIRLSRIIPLLDAHCKHTLVFSGQNFSPELSIQFFEQLEIRPPDYSLNTQADTSWRQIANMLCETEKLLTACRPDRFLVLGDTNTALTSLVAKRMGIPVLHMEAGNRCHDDRVPEEVNRRVIDHVSDLLLPYTRGSAQNLLREGLPSAKILVTGNPIREVIEFYHSRIERSDILQQLQLIPKKYFLATLHRAENVDVKERLHAFMDALKMVQERYGIPVLLSLHPHTRAALASSGYMLENSLRFLPPPGFFDFVHLEKHAKAILSDSGTVQEEACLLQVPTVTLRDVTERPETVECGSNILSGASPQNILNCLELALCRRGGWNAPPEYLESNVSHTVAHAVLGMH